MGLFGKIKFRIRSGNKEEKPMTKYIHPTHVNGMCDDIDNIVEQLNAAVVIAKRMKVNSCETEKFKMYKKMFHELWLGVAKYYNNINNVDVNLNSDGIYID